ncbi:response regulator transcription factor [Mucilaginibacter paludis]|uniref:Response regulator receiver protein n=1 Tax=Mucilaginibacter paludis DSM 18603 TaxID=714943 RepID=H1Y8H2_9SPHI|nr:response regulator [Mucilaginibacter paludis]EHQ25890.1 response regulator receiver protein [Mucilaginibacter paludis DSM 18603]
MFEKVLIAEDHQTTSISVKQILAELRIQNCDYAYYCDEALTRIRNEQASGQAYELLITDLSFGPGSHSQILTGGAALIAAARQVQPDLKILVFSIENKPIVIERLFDELKINGYVGKGREDALELRQAVENIAKGRRHIPAGLRHAVKQINAHDFSEIDLTIVRLISEGKSQKQISAYFTENAIKPSSLSTIEKRLALMREAYGFSNNEQLIVYCRETGLA